VTSSSQSSDQQFGKAGPQILVAILTAAPLSIVQIMVPRPMLIFERFVTGGGWIEIAILAAYAAWLYGKMRDPKQAAVWRPRIWRLFSIVFFGQLLLGLARI
jgi:ferredoxin-type protein NapH